LTVFYKTGGAANMQYDLCVKSPFLSRKFVDTQPGFVTELFEAYPERIKLLKRRTNNEGVLKINGKIYVIGGSVENSLIYEHHVKTGLERGGEQLEIVFSLREKEIKGISVSLIYEAFGNSPVLVKSIRIENRTSKAIKLDGIMVEEIIPSNNGEKVLIIENDYVRDAMKINGQRCRSPWIEHQEKYVKDMLCLREELTVFSYPVELEKWIFPGDVFNSFRVFEFVVSNLNEELKGLDFRRATRKLMPWTTKRWLSCALVPAENSIEEYYHGIELAADAGYEAIHLHHGWIAGKLTSPLFTTYADYKLRPELFPNGWEDVKKLTDFAHSRGMKISFYTIYVSIWDSYESKAVAENKWELVWDEDDNSERWGTTLCPGTDWGQYINMKMEEAMIKGGFDAWHLDGPYYGDISIAENRPYKAGGVNQPLAWERQTHFYRRMCANGFHGEAAQGFCAFAHGMSRITTTGYDEGDFGSLDMWGQILSTRRGAYKFTKIYRPEQATTFIPVVSWLNGPCLEPMEEHAEEYNAYLANCFGYGFQGKCFQHLPWEGPKSKAAVQRWLNFWKMHSAFFENGFLLHVREPDGVKIDAVLHFIDDKTVTHILLVIYNPAEFEQQDCIKLPLDILNLPTDGWKGFSESGEEVSCNNGNIIVCVPARDATWYELHIDIQV